MYIHRFLPASIVNGASAGEGAWAGRIKAINDKQQKVLEEVQDIHKSIDNKME